ncbi:DUF6542 domain-containing protein [Amycolatopsis suaedae]|uniref:DUF6542 domain-containing protein n=1 Tax=Amycolatopsis suaedae TaxID=2510978 RepID=A0A4Q7J9J5_9PSEU|nr:DUF6542 domain-containing protein [Amycolatopsis suaedae]RZQ63572.1 hypothetical protein EWH70_14225 [Amycolatopsis suaedae]
MTAVPDRRSDPDADDVDVPWDELPVIGVRRGLPWWAAVLLALGLSVIGAVVNLQLDDGKLDLQISGVADLLFHVCFFLGSVGAICAVQRRSLFGPMVQPPLVLAVTVLGVVLLVSGLPDNADMLQKGLAVGTPLINGFPTMAITTAVVLAIGFYRIYRERDPDAPVKGEAKPAEASRPPAPPRKPREPREGARPSGARRGRDDLDGPPPRGGGRPPQGGPRRGSGAASGGAAAGGAAGRGRRPRPDDPPPRRSGERGAPERAGGARPRRPRPEDGEPPRRRGEAPGSRGDAPGSRGRGQDPRGRRSAPPRRPWEEDR